MNKSIFIIWTFVLLFSCAEEVIKKPEDLIPRDTMTELLYEMAVLNAAKGTNEALLEKNLKDPTEFLLRLHGVDSLQFVKSDMYYASQPLVYEAIYRDIEARLEREKTAFEEMRQKRNDSLVSRNRELKDSLGGKRID